MPEFRLPVYDEFDVVLEDAVVRESVEAFEELRYKVFALEVFWLDMFDGWRKGSPARSIRVFRFWAGSGTDIRKPRTCIDNMRNPQFDP